MLESRIVLRNLYKRRVDNSFNIILHYRICLSLKQCFPTFVRRSPIGRDMAYGDSRVREGVLLRSSRHPECPTREYPPPLTDPIISIGIRSSV